MKYIISQKYAHLISEKIMGPNPVKLTEELLQHTKTKAGSVVLDLGSGQGITSAFLAKECKHTVYAADLWSNPSDNMRFFETLGLTSKEIIPLHADANELPFANEFFDAVFCTDSYNYFGREKNYLEDKLLPFVKHKGWIYIAVTGMKKDCHDALPKELLASWTPEQLDYIHDANWWENLLSETKGVAELKVFEMEANKEVWDDWLACENEYAVGDRKAFAVGGGKYLNFVGIIIQRE